MATQTLLTTGTTFVSSLLASYNLSTSAVIVAGTHPVYLDSISFLKFDLSSLPAASVSSAILRLYVFSKSGVAPSPIAVNRVTSAFDINTVTYNTMPTYVPTGITTNITTGDVLTYVEIDVTTLINQWLNGTFPNNGIALTNSDGITDVLFGGKPVGAAFEPQLVVTFVPVGELEGIQAQLQGDPGGIIVNNANVMFDTVIIDQAANISYNAATGEFTISGDGNYYVNWWVATDGSAGPVNMVFALLSDGAPIATGNSPIVTGQVDGDAFLSVSGSPVTVTLVNQTGAAVLYGDIPVQANISIITVKST
ncbi:MAG: DNRLRE domain-containing protein [Anaerocolumna sp.]